MGGRSVVRVVFVLVAGLVLAGLGGAPGHARAAAEVRANAVVADAAPSPSGAARSAKPPKPVVKKVRPASGPAAGGTVVRIKGKNFTKVKKVLFGKTKGTAVKVKSKRKLTVVAPPHAAGTVAVKVVTKGGKSKKSRKARFTYRASTPVPPQGPVVSGLSPDAGPTDGGTVVTISGTRFSGTTAISFGDTPATAFTVQSDTTIEVTSPPHAAGPVGVTVQTPAGTSAPVTYTYETSPAPPVVTLVAPPTGTMDGGTAVTITGSGFTGATSVTFGGTPATAVTVDSDTQISATTPAHAAGPVDVAVTTPVGTSTVPGLFAYLPVAAPPPVVVLVAPLTGPESGGTVVTITGTGFSGATAVSFGGTAATSFTVDSDIQITATTPAHAAGLVAVSVTTPVDTSTVPGLFTYVAGPPVPVVLLVAPPIGPPAGGTSVTITGTGFTGATAVSFGGTPATSYVVDSDMQITATTPAHAMGAVDVTVTTPGGTSPIPGLFTYLL